MRQDVIKQITKLDSVTHVIVLTHNIDFIFLQSVFLSALKQCGHPSLTIFADAQCARETFQYQHHVLAGLGSRYRVVPVEMSPGFRFHPKAIFLSGTDSASLFIGSGNMTFGGLRENAEIWARYDTEAQEGEAFSAFREYLNDVERLIVLPEVIGGEIEEAFTPSTHKWVEQLPDPGMVIGHAGRGPGLIDRIQAVLGDRAVDALYVCSPYFDTSASALVTVSSTVGNPETTVFIQDKRSTLYKSSADHLPDHIQLKTIDYRTDTSDESSASRFIHAKFLAFVQGSEVTVFSGSANCSQAALILDGRLGNAELFSYRTIGLEAFESEYLGEFEIKENPPELVDKPEDEEVEDPSPKIRILAARYDVGEILVGYKISKTVKIDRCLINDEPFNYQTVGKNTLSISYSGLPKTICIEGTLGASQVVSNVFWVDLEENLRSTAKGRGLLDGLKRRHQSGIWKVGEWGLILDLFVQDLDYVSPRNARQKEKSDDAKPKSFTVSRDDVFASSYDRAPTTSGSLIDSFGNPSFSIQQMLLYAFGIQTSTQGPENPVDDENTNVDINGAPNEEMTDLPEEVGRKVVQKIETEEEITPNQRKKVSKLVDAVVGSMTDEEYLQNRSPRRLGIDLQIAGLLLRMGLSKGWINDQEFFEATQYIWSALFVTSSAEQGMGWLVYRYLNSESPDDFESEMSSVGLSATLFAWALAASAHDDLYAKQFFISQCISAGQLPWLWLGGEEEEIFERTLSITKQTPCGLGDLDASATYALRISLIRKGVALASLQQLIESVGLETIRDQIEKSELKAEDILWQGKKGICLVLKTPGDQDDRIETICLQNPEGKIEFIRKYVLPLNELLNTSVIKDTPYFTPKHKQAVIDLMQDLQTA